MHLIENYSLAAGVKISQPHIEPSFFPVQSEKYITFHNSSGMKSKNYSYYINVFKKLRPILKENNIDIIQIGGDKEEVLEGVIDLTGKTSIRQCAFVIKNSILHLGNDSFSSHLAAFFKVPLVCLYGPVLLETCKPYWGDESKQILLSPDYSNRKPSFSNNEINKRVDEIFPETIIKSCLDLLHIPHSLDSITPIHIGEFFNKHIIEIIPDFKPDSSIKIKEGSLINLRLDYTNNPYMTEYWLQQHNCTIYAEEYIDLKLISQYKNNIYKIFLYVNEHTKLEYIESIISSGIKIKLICKDLNTISNIRLNLFPHNVFDDENLSEKDLDNPGLLCDNNCYYESSISIIKDNKIFPCKIALDKGFEKQSFQPTINEAEFFRDIEYFKIFKDDKNKNN